MEIAFTMEGRRDTFGHIVSVSVLFFSHDNLCPYRELMKRVSFSKIADGSVVPWFRVREWPQAWLPLPLLNVRPDCLPRLLERTAILASRGLETQIFGRWPKKRSQVTLLNLTQPEISDGGLFVRLESQHSKALKCGEHPIYGYLHACQHKM
jgi:hypothetical protein